MTHKLTQAQRAALARKRAAARAKAKKLQEQANRLYFEVYEDVTNDWRWRIEAGNGEIMADSAEGYSDKAGVQKAVRELNRADWPLRVKVSKEVEPVPATVPTVPAEPAEPESPEHLGRRARRRARREAALNALFAEFGLTAEQGQRVFAALFGPEAE
jgi:uncharacterized protein YegP (UPF0339 family)